MSTILKWAGNKTDVMSELKKHLPAGSRLVEPFAGSCAVMMATDYYGTFTAYHAAGFNEDDQYHLASILERRSSEGHPVVVSNSDTSLTRSLYRNFIMHGITTKRSMGVDAGDGKSAVEIIAVSRMLRSRRTHSTLARVCPAIDEARA